ncbi:hypothetical protein SynA1825c_01068 [Synechococcus sp. A18-25c]|uniref:hypothetical protein n=1 Tax=Synechococcus sp. A18-25c TaxID=1866938 RepID=UPI000C45C903|nr:hypothetical protein [Synechococcus sp. A18-25c]MAN19692.1 hypothetical protein [Synechococcus sp. EAC657]MEC7247589.1 hypothetical protein [Cyanobacteriota bacterium]QNI47734.1 hypothetical protein SynA1560_01071 [Synechococcus sp. A15-60]MEC7896329.1 hypothetical protein [Cyanobacteriota bacterium]QNJ19378.1 hypothetical protein SynA1825c_01068 [Synechococcus sp. A18-25c]|tara:strand:+ start:392 stop:637 length:246 start_codon:yes stop_codon:yes gene_type:complete
MFNRKLWLPLIIVVVCDLQASTARAQRVVKKLTSECPMGYIDTANGKCSALGLMTYTLRPAMGDECPPGWSSIGGDYCRRD